MTPTHRIRRYFYLAHDLLVLCLALVAALYLRHGVPLIQEGKPDDIYLLLAVTFCCGLAVLPLMRMHTSMWRFTSSAEIMNLMIAVALVIAASNSLLFITSRLHMMPRSVPPMHWALAVVGMGTSRLAARRIAGPDHHSSKYAVLKQHVIVLGACHTAELYLRFIKRIVQHEVVVEGLVDSDPSFTGRVFQRHTILGTPLQLPQILEKLLVHGIAVKHVVLARLFEELSTEEKQLLIELKKSGMIDLIHFGKHMGAQQQPALKPQNNSYYQQLSELSPRMYEVPHGIYPHVKHVLDTLVAAGLLVILSPLIALTSLLVCADVGMPILFWQQRPGLFGKPFRLYKFRTMRSIGRKANEDRLAHKSGDELRTSKLGKWLRRLRLDELPQLFHILTGTMSFVGPRPLLPDDQPESGQQRLSVRPGVTGWAQIHGGDALTPAEKLLLDVWYIRHLSFWLDLRILIQTLIVVLRPDTRKAEAIERIRNSLTHS